MFLFFADDSERSLHSAETASIEEGVLYGSSVELRQSHKKIGTLKRKSVAGAAKPPPRPTPGSVTYTDDESDKAYDHNPDESSLTEKPSEISSTDSQVRKPLASSTLLDVFKVSSSSELNNAKLSSAPTSKSFDISSVEPLYKTANGKHPVIKAVVPTKLFPRWAKSSKIMPHLPSPS